MKSSFKRATAGLGAFAVLGGVFLVGASSAEAVSNPLPWLATENSTANGPAERVGDVAFYNAAGQQVYSGNADDHPIAAYFVASGGVTAHGSASAGATARIAAPTTGVDPQGWGQDTVAPTAPLSATQDASYTALPASIQSSQRAVVPASSTDFSINDFLTYDGYANNYPSPDNHVYEIRIGTGNPGEFYSADIDVDPTSGNWTEVYPATPPAADGTALSTPVANPASPTAGTTSVALTSTLSDTTHAGTIPTGSVELFNGSTDVGAATLNTTTGAVSATATVAASTSYNFKFVYTPTGTFAASTSPVLAYSVPGPAVSTTTTVSGPTTGTVGTAVTFKATVTAASGSAAGTVQFKVDGANFGTPVSLATAASGVNYTPGDTNPHTITASFIPTNPAAFNASSDTTGVTITAAAAASAPDPQNVTVHVPSGSLVISTPYTAANPLALHDLTVDPDGQHLSNQPTNFGDPAAPAAGDPGNGAGASTTNGVTITDTRAGSKGWIAHVVTGGTDSAGTVRNGDFTDGAGNSIDGQYLSFTNVKPKYLTGNHLNATTNPINTASVSNVKAGGDFAFIGNPTTGPAGIGTGTVDVTGQLQLTNVPTSTVPGDYTATLTFTII